MSEREVCCLSQCSSHFLPFSFFSYRFDGSGYIHSLRLDAETQTANYSGQFVQTPILKVGEGGRGGISVEIVPSYLNEGTKTALCCNTQLVTLPPRPAKGEGVGGMSRCGSISVPDQLTKKAISGGL